MTDWQVICDNIDEEFSIDELRAIATSIDVDLTNVRSKRDMCLLIAQDYLEYTKPRNRKCSNPTSLLGDDFDTLQDEDIVEYEEGGRKWCFSADELLTVTQNPYTKKPIPKSVIDEARMKRRAPANPRKEVHRLKVRVQEQSPIQLELKERLDQLTIPRDQLVSMNPITARRLVEFVYRQVTGFTADQKRDVLLAMGSSVDEGILLLLNHIPDNTFAETLIDLFFQEEVARAEPIEFDAVRRMASLVTYMFMRTANDFNAYRVLTADAVEEAELTQGSSLRDYVTVVVDTLTENSYWGSVSPVIPIDENDLRRALVDRMARTWLPDEQMDDIVDSVVESLVDEDDEQFIFAARYNLRTAILPNGDMWPVFVKDTVLQLIESTADPNVHGFRPVLDDMDGVADAIVAQVGDDDEVFFVMLDDVVITHLEDIGAIDFIMIEENDDDPFPVGEW